MYTQKTFIKIAKTYGYTPIPSNEKIFYGLSGGKPKINNILTFKERPQYQCEVSQKNTQKILNILKGGEKLKESEMFRANKILEKNKLKEEKLEQLKVVFKAKIKDIISRAKLRQAYFETDDYIQKIADGFVYEVKIRTNNK